MILPDVNVLVYAHRPETAHHGACRTFLESALNSDQAFGLADIVVSGFLRIVTHPRAFDTPTPLSTALSFVETLRDQPNRVTISPGERHWDIFIELCQEVGARGNLVPDAYLAAIAIESGCEWITTDRDFSRFPRLRWRDPRNA